MTVIPNFLLKRMYAKGSLRLVPEGVAFDITNNLGTGLISKLNSISFNGLTFLSKDVILRVEGLEIPGEAVTEENPAHFNLNQTVTCIVRTVLDPGTYDMAMDLVSKEAGRVTLSVQDQLHGQSPA